MNRLCTGWWRDCGWISNRHKGSPPPLQGDQTSFGTCPASYSVSTVGVSSPWHAGSGTSDQVWHLPSLLFGQYCGGLFCLAWMSWDMRLITLIYLVPRLRMHGAVPLLICLLGIHRDNFTLTYRIEWCTLSAFQGNTSVQKMVATAFPEMFVPLYRKTWCHIPEVCNFNILSLFTFCNF